ncbi:MAG: methyltransferase [Alphaproteobacteria bacterium]|nr:methyltransferase [Alphaproteobacteria bacterium]
MAEAEHPGEGYDETTLLGGRLRLLQPLAGHRSGLDAILLSAMIGEAQGVLADAGAGAGAAGLAIGLRNRHVQLLLIEREEELAALARRNAALNAMVPRVQVACADFTSPKARAAAGIAPASVAIAVTNPPWLEAARSRSSPDQARARAHSFETGQGLDRWLRACAAILQPSGELAMIHRADALGQVLDACSGRFGGLEIRPVHPRAGEAAIRILLRGRKGSRAPLKLLPALIVHGEGQAFTPQMQAINAGGPQLL